MTNLVVITETMFMLETIVTQRYTYMSRLGMTIIVIFSCHIPVFSFFRRLRYSESKKSQDNCYTNHREYKGKGEINSEVQRAVVKNITTKHCEDIYCNQNTPYKRNTTLFESFWRRIIVLSALMRTDARSTRGGGFAFGGFCFLCHNIQYIYPLWRLQTQKQGEANAACL